MSLVMYVLYGSGPELSPATWGEVAAGLATDGYPLISLPPPGADSVRLAAMSEPTEVLLNFEERDSNEAFGDDAGWSAEARELIDARPRSLFLQAVHRAEHDGPLDFWNAVTGRLAEALDGVIYVEAADILIGPGGATFSIGDGD